MFTFFNLIKYADMMQKYIDIENHGFRGLLNEALKYDTFEEFEKSWLRQIKHGQYWHITDNPNFKIDTNLGPRDMSSLGTGAIDKGKLMITSDLDYWSDSYTDIRLTGGRPRRYAALIDMSNVPKDQYYQVNRGFGNEFFVNDPSLAKVIDVMPIEKALKLSENWNKQKPQNKEQLKHIYNKAHNVKDNNDNIEILDKISINYFSLIKFD